MADVVKVVDDGLAIITDRLKGAGGAEPHHVAWGTDGTAATTSDSDMGTESAESRVEGTSSQQTDTATNDTYRVVGEITASASRAIQEVGLFDDASAGNMFLHGTFDTINLNNGDSVEFTIDVTFADGS